MKKHLRYSLLALTLLPFVLSSCAKASYRDDLTCTDISAELCDEVDVIGGYSSYSREDVDLLFKKTELFNDQSVVYSTDANDINEIGVFHCSDEQKAKELVSAVEEYISEQQNNQKAFIASYAPREVPKLEGAEIRRYGNYVIYSILDEKSQNKVWEEIQDILKKQV